MKNNTTMRNLFFLLLITLFLGCDKENYSDSNMNFNDTIILPYGKLLHNEKDNISIYLDSILYDSRCPLGFECMWEGNAKVRFKFISNHTESDLLLNTYSQFSRDTMIKGYKITMVSLAPFPRSGVKTEQKEYSATIVIK
jgi:hypothetical protein